jgi:hypothetical protein
MPSRSWPSRLALRMDTTLQHGPSSICKIAGLLTLLNLRLRYSLRGIRIVRLGKHVLHSTLGVLHDTMCTAHELSTVLTGLRQARCP